MKTLGVALACALFLAAAAPQASAQARSGAVEGTKSPLAAGVLEWFLPTAGFAYAGDWHRGLVPNAVRVAGILVAGLSLYAESVDDDEYCHTACGVAAVAAVAGTIWAIAGAVGTAKDRNAAARRSPAQAGPLSRLMVMPSAGGGLSVGLRVAW